VNGEKVVSLEPELGGGAPGAAGVTAVGMGEGGEDGRGAAFDPAESGVSLPHGEAQGRALMVNLRGAVTVEATARSAVAQMSRGAGEGGDGARVPSEGSLVQTVPKRVFEFADAFFHAAVVGRVIGGAVQGDDARIGEEGIEEFIIGVGVWRSWRGPG
jgi:hypothetical protein